MLKLLTFLEKMYKQYALLEPYNLFTVDYLIQDTKKFLNVMLVNFELQKFLRSLLLLNINNFEFFRLELGLKGEF